jgi:hypothetical protein
MRKAISPIGRWLAVLAICIAAKLLPSFWYEFNRMQGIQATESDAVAIGVLAILVVASIETFRTIDCLLDKKTWKMFRHAGSALIASVLLLYPWWGYDLGNPIEHARFALLRKRADECAATAQQSYSTYKFNTCEKRFAWSHDHFLVYDTSGQIALRRDARASEFADYLKKSESWMYTECPFKSTEFAPHFFYVETYFCDTPAE